MLWLEQRSGIRHAKYRIGKIEQCTRFPISIVSRRINNSRRHCWMFAQSRRPTSRHSVRTTKQTRVCADARETTRAREIDESQGFSRLQIGKITLLKRSSSYRTDSGRLAKRLNEGAVFIKPDVQYAETPIRRVKPVSARLAEKHWPVVSIVDTREDTSKH